MAQCHTGVLNDFSGNFLVNLSYLICIIAKLSHDAELPCTLSSCKSRQ